jgi:hypothetical protein
VVVHYNGVTGHPIPLGPVSTPTSHRRITITDFTVSPDGNWLAWDEVVTKPTGELTSQVMLVIRELRPANVYQLSTQSRPVGFVNDQLVVSDGTQTSVVVLSPSPSLEPVGGSESPRTTYPQGIVTVQRSDSPPDAGYTDELGLTTFDDSTTVLHDYEVAGGDTRPPRTATMSSDGTQLVVERSAHASFASSGPSSTLDEYTLSADPATRVVLGHPGAAAAGWWLGGLSFASDTDQVWAVWHRLVPGKGVQSMVAVSDHLWHQIVPTGIAVAGNADDYVVAQPGRYVLTAHGRHYRVVPSGDGLLLHDGTVRVLGVGGTAFAWVQ